MSIDLSDLLTGGLNDLAAGVIDIVDEYIESPDEKRAAISRVEQLSHELSLAKSNEIIAEINKRGSVIEAELKQGDNYTKRARPTVVYGGLVLIFLAYIVAPVFFGKTLTLPEPFWIAWGGICSIWSIGRSAERVAPQGIVSKLLNSTEPYKNVVAQVIGRGK